jgi:SH3 domain-containing YSC84-like protein 1
VTGTGVLLTGAGEQAARKATIARRAKSRVTTCTLPHLAKAHTGGFFAGREGICYWTCANLPGFQRKKMITAMQIESPSRRNALRVLAAAALGGCASQPASGEPEALVADARTTLSNFIRDPDQTWIQDNLNRARAILIAPQVVRAGFIFGGSGGRGVLVSRDGRAWAGPAFYNLATASVGFQAGIDVSEVIVVVMTDTGFNSLLSTSFKIGGDASIAAGPVGAGARSTITADLISFTRAKGVYGGLNLDGTVVSANVPWNDAFFGGSNLLPPDILIRRKVTSPKAAPLLADVAKAAK